MSFSVNTNTGAMAALKSLSETNRGLSVTQNRINTGLNVASTKDDSASFAIAQKLRGDVSGIRAVNASLSRAKSVTDVAIAGAEQLSDLFSQMRAKAVEASDAGVDATSRNSMASDITALKNQINNIIQSSSFNGTNLLKGGGGMVEALQTLSSSGSSGKLVINDFGQDTAVAASLGTAGGAVTLADAAAADTLIGVIDALRLGVNSTLTTLGSASRQIDGQLAFNSKLSDVFESGVGNLVDADLAKESAKLQAFQVKQQLGLQALSIANQAPQSIMSLFRG